MEKHEIERQYLDAYEELADSIFRRCYFKTSDREVARDLTQDTFLKVWDYLAEGNTVRNLKGLVFTTANNLIKDYYKKKKSVTIGSMNNYDPNTIPDETEDVEFRAEVSQAIGLLDRLEESERDLMIMRFVDGMSPKEIAEILDERENTISVRIHRVTKKLRVFIE